jgi:hypothetical protein
MKFLITESQFSNTIKRLVLSTFDEIKSICEEDPDADTFPSWLGFDDCEAANLIDKIEINDINKEESRFDIYGNKYPRFIVWINVYYYSGTNAIGLYNIGYAIGERIFKKYKIKTIVRVQEEINTNTERNW